MNSAQLLLAGMLSIAATPIAIAQGTDAGIRGDARDITGRPIAGASVRVVNISTGFTTQSIATAAGRFTFVQLPLGGPYTVTATAIGYRPATRTGITLNIGGIATVELRLTPVEVRLDEVAVVAEQVQTIERTGAATRIGEAQLAALPNQDRRFQDLTSLSPLARPGTTLGGSRPISTDVRIDGVGAQMNNTGQTFAGPLTMSVEAIREFEVVTNEYDVSKGRQGGGLINAVTKTGTNQVAGSVFSYNRNQRLTASIPQSRSGTRYDCAKDCARNPTGVARTQRRLRADRARGWACPADNRIPRQPRRRPLPRRCGPSSGSPGCGGCVRRP